MLARYLRRDVRPVQYAMQTADMRPSLMFGIKSLLRRHNVQHEQDKLRESLRGYGAVTPGFEGHYNMPIEQHGRRDMEFLHDAISDAVGTGNPDALNAILMHVHDTMGLGPLHPHANLHAGLPSLLAYITNAHNQTQRAIENPAHPLRQYTPELTADPDMLRALMDRQRNFLQSIRSYRGEMEHPDIQALLPEHGGRGIAGLHDAYDLTRMQPYDPDSPLIGLEDLIHGLHRHLVRASGLTPEQLGGR